ncbi:VRR-NUC domain-containing protein [Candidatus Saccharibacteria bacterium]|nr:VRR-NUC domain-containing protein [Candidatus Saccharibacteria bacterium]
MNGIAKDFDPTKKPKQREFKIEDYLINQVEKIGGKCYKWVAPGCDGVPDRIVMFKGCVIFVETKRPKGKPRLLQKIRHKELQKQGMLTAVADTKLEVDSLVATLVSKGLSNDRNC